MDVDSIEPGADFVAAIEQALSRCEVLLVVIGPHWLAAADATGRRRIDDPRDFVRLEVALALHRGIRVIPVLVDGASEPHAHQLPADLSGLAQRQAVKVSHDRIKLADGGAARTLRFGGEYWVTGRLGRTVE